MFQVCSGRSVLTRVHAAGVPEDVHEGVQGDGLLGRLALLGRRRRRVSARRAPLRDARPGVEEGVEGSGRPGVGRP